MSKWNDFQNGLCTDEEYIKSEYNGFIGKVVYNNHNYYVFNEPNQNINCYYIRDFENGVLSGINEKENLTFDEVFNTLCQKDDYFKTYVNTKKEDN